MKICLASIHPRRLSGQIESLVALSRELEGLGQPVSLASAFDDYTNATTGYDGGDGYAAKLVRLLRALRTVSRAARGCDIIHVNLPTPSFAFLADLLRLRTRLPVVVGFEAHLANCGQLLRSGYLFRDPSFYLPRFFINNSLVVKASPYRCDSYVVSSRVQARELAKLGLDEGRIRVIPNLANTSKLHVLPQAEARQRLGLPAGPLVAYAGHYHHVKGVDVALAAFRRVLDAHPQAHLAVAWSGIGEPGPVERLADELKLGPSLLRLGVVPMGELLSAADVVMLPYRLTIGQNAFPNLVLEALTVGAPLVTSRLPLLEELIQEGETGLLADPEDHHAVAAAALSLLDDPVLSRQMRSSQRRFMQRSLAPQRLAQHYLALYSEVLYGQADLLQPVASGPKL